MNVLPRHKREQIIHLLVEGNSIRSTARLADVTHKTVLRLLCRVGAVCEDYQNVNLTNLTCRRLEVDEMWGFCHTRRSNCTPEKRGQLGYGDLWIFVAIDPETKLVPVWWVGKRTAENTVHFMQNLKSRVVNRVEISTDGFNAYKDAVDVAFGEDVDYGMLVKIYEDGKTDPETLPLHGEPGIRPHRIKGNPQHTSTSIVERQNLTLRQSTRRLMRRTTGFSKKVINHNYAICLYYMHYNFVRIHSSLRVTPAMAAGVTDRLWTIGDILDLLDYQWLLGRPEAQAVQLSVQEQLSGFNL